MKLSLVVLSQGKMKGQPIAIKGPQFLIGRDSRCQLRPASPLVSNRHCALLVKEGKVFVKDYGSTNGTFINEKQVSGEMEVQNEDTLRVGPVAFTVRIEARSPLDKPTPPPPTKRGEPVDDEAAAALLLALQDGADGPEAGSYGVDSEGVPTGTTVMDVPIPATAEAPKEGEKAGEKKPDDKKDKAKAASGDTASAAESILQKYMRRPRSNQ
jgi:pSer/pThr/pTyr-binding forkhead associated (FHA) protein